MKCECYICGKWSNLEKHHVFEGAGRRQISEQYGAFIHICPACHRDIHSHPKKYLWLKERWQRIVMDSQGWSTEQFIDKFGRNYDGGNQMDQVGD